MAMADVKRGAAAADSDLDSDKEEKSAQPLSAKVKLQVKQFYKQQESTEEPVQG